MDTKKYNGHANWATWNVNLWIGNEYGLYTYWQEVAQTIFDEAEGDSEVARENLTDRLRNEFLADDAFNDSGKSLFAQDCDRSDLEYDVVWADVANCQLEGCETDVDGDTVEYEESEEIDIDSLDADGLNELLASLGKNWAEVAETDPERLDRPSKAEIEDVRNKLKEYYQ